MFLLRVQLTRPPLAEEDSVLGRIKHMCIVLLCLEAQWLAVYLVGHAARDPSANGRVAMGSLRQVSK